MTDPSRSCWIGGQALRDDLDGWLERVDPDLGLALSEI
jgi:hypothetical protein